MRRLIMSALGTRAFTLLLTFCANVLIARALGRELRGQYAVMLAIPALMSAFGSAGIETANLYYAGQSSRSFFQVSRWSIAFSFIISLVIGTIYLGTAQYVRSLSLGLTQNQLVCSVLVTPVLLNVALLGVAQAGSKRLAIYNFTLAGSMLAYLFVVVVLVLMDQVSLISVFVAYVGVQTITLLALVLTSKPWRIGEGPGPNLKEFVKYGRSAFFVSFTQYVLLRADTFIIQLLAGAAAVGLYAVAYSLSEALYLIAVAVNLVLLPRLARSELSKDNTLKVALVTLLLSIACALCLAIAAPFLIPLAFGSEFSGATRLLLVLLPGSILLNFGRVLQSHFSGLREFQQSFIASIIALAVLLTIEISLIPRIGAMGAAVASTISYAIFAAVMYAYFTRHQPHRENVRGPSMQSPSSDYVRWVEQVEVDRLAPGTGFSTRLMRNRATSFRSFVILLPIAALSVAIGWATVTHFTMALAGMGFAGLLVLVFRPEWGLLFVAAIAPFTVPLSQYASQSALLITVALIPSLVGLFIVRGARWPKTGLTHLLIAVYFISSWLTGGSVPGTQLTLREGLLVAFTLIAPILLLPLFSASDRTRSLLPQVIAGSVLLVSGWYLLNARDFLGSTGTTVETWMVVSNQVDAGNHNVLGALVILAVAILLPRLTDGPRPLERPLILFALALLLIAAMYSFSRSTYLALPAMFVAFLVLRGVRSIAVGLFVAAIGFQLLPRAVIERIAFTSSGVNGGLDASSAVRLDLWRAASSMFQDYPVFGVGLYQFARNLPRYWAPSSLSGMGDIDPTLLIFAHNTLLTIASQLGLVGLLLVGRLAWTMTRDALAATKSSQTAMNGESALLALLGIGVASMFGEPLFTPVILVPFVLIMSLATPQDARRCHHQV